jgi:two-component system, NtrC family, sensor kinase
MFPRGIRSNIALKIGTLLVAAMLLINFVMIIMAKRDLVKSEMSKGLLYISLIEGYLTHFGTIGEALEKNNIDKLFPSLRYHKEIACGLVLDKEGRTIYVYGRGCLNDGEPERLARQAMGSGKTMSSFTGTTWGVFWRQKRDLIVSAPLRYGDGEIIGGASTVVHLDEVYHALRRSQSLLFFYIFTNALILSLFGLYWISNITLKPLQRLARRADEYTEDDEMFFPVRIEDSEINRLSKALNKMLKRISEDKEKLQETVRSLEQANVELGKAQEDVIRAEKLASVGRFSSGIAHEIGNPIGIIMGYLDLLKKKGVSETEREDYLSRSQSELDRIRTIIRQLLDFSRPSTGDLRPVPVHDIIDDVSKIAKTQPLMTQLHVERLLSASDHTVIADPNKLRQVFVNLMINAADAIASSPNSHCGKLTIKSETFSDHDGESGSQDRWLKLMYIDNGHGIPPEHVVNVFDPFYSTKEPGKGTGLGLSVCYMIVEEIGGTIAVSSEALEGTTVTILLPLVEESVLQK